MKGIKSEIRFFPKCLAVTISPIMAVVLLIAFAGCKRENQDFDPRERYGEDIRSFAEGDPNRLPYLAGSDFQPVWKKQELPEDARRVPGFSFVDQNGQGFGSSELSGNIYLANFFFTECNGICPMIMPRLRQVQNDISDLQKVEMISLSVTPDVDTPKVMKDYAGRLGIQEVNWHLLTGNRERIYSLARDTFGADTELRSRKGAQDFLHSEEAFLVDRNGYLRGIYNVRGSGDLKRLVADIRLLHQEK
ncbi:MAG: SCO family protein [Leptospiraceae bacterium]